MSTNPSRPPDNWGDGDAYEAYVGRWSRVVARDFLAWLDVPSGKSWLDAGCGTGALTATVLSVTGPSHVLGIDPSLGFLRTAQARIPDERAGFAVGTAESLPESPATRDVAVSGLVLNLVPRPGDAVQEMARVVRPGGLVAVYVWDYAGRMEFMRYFWDAAVALDPAAASLDQGARFPICTQDGLAGCFTAAGLADVQTRAIDAPTTFRDFDDFWAPFLGGTGSAPSYVATLTSDRQARLRDRLRQALPFEPDGSIRLVARAWAVRGHV